MTFTYIPGFPLITPHSQNPKEGDMAHYTCEAQFGGPNVDDISVDHYPELKMLIDEEVIPEKEQSDSDNKFHFNKVRKNVYSGGELYARQKGHL